MKKSICLLVIALLLPILLSNQLAAFTLLNYANLALIRGKNITSAYQQALFLSPNNTKVRWQVMRAALVDNNKSLAAQSVGPLVEILNSDSLLFADGLRALELNGKTSELVTLYEGNRHLNQSTIVSDTTALAYIAQGKLDSALILRPDDLYLNTYLWRLSKAAQKINLENNIRSKLTYFANNAINPSNERILQYTTKAILQLYEYRIWSREDVIRVVTYLVWKYSNVNEVEFLLENLKIRHSDDPMWSELATELFQRKRKTARLISGDWIFNTQNAENNLVQDTSFNNLNYIALAKENVFWYWRVWQGKDNSEALFLSGPDLFESTSALRITNLWQRPIQINVIPPYAEYVSEAITLERDAQYTLTLRYKTDKLGKAIAFVALLDYTVKPQFVFTHTDLPSTMGDWQRWEVSGKSHTKPIKVQLLIRMSGVGSVWFDDIQLVKTNN